MTDQKVTAETDEFFQTGSYVGLIRWIEYWNKKRNSSYPVSYALISSHDSTHQNVVLWFIYTHPSNRREGHARKLLEELKSCFQCIATGKGGTSDVGVAFMEKCGFKEAEDKSLIWKKEGHDGKNNER